MACCRWRMLSFFTAMGFSNAFGVFVEYYLSHQLAEESPDKVAWIGSLAVFFQFVSGNIGGPLFDRYGAWVRLAPKLTLLIRSANIITDNPTGRRSLHLFHYDDEPLPRVLSIHAGTRRPDGFLSWDFYSFQRWPQCRNTSIRSEQLLWAW